MSLINEVLRKLDQQAQSSGSAGGATPLRAVPGRGWRTSGRVVAVAAVIFLAGAAVGIAGWWAWSGQAPGPEAGGSRTVAGTPKDAGGRSAPVKGTGAARDTGSDKVGEGADPAESDRATEEDALALELPPVEDERARVQAAPPQAPPPEAGPARPAGSGTDLKRPRSGRLKIALVPPAERTLRDDRAAGQAGEGGGPTGRQASARPEAGKVQVEVPQSWRDSRKAAELGRAGYQALGEQRYSEAIARLSRARRLAPGRTDIINNLALAQWQDGQRAAAVATLSEGLRENPEDYRMARNLAHFLERGTELPEREAGVRLLAGALKRQDRLPLYALVGSLYRDLGQPGRAISVYRTGIARKGRHWRLLVGLGLALEADGQPERARAIYQRAQDQLPQGQQQVRASLAERLKALDRGPGN